MRRADGVEVVRPEAVHRGTAGTEACGQPGIASSRLLGGLFGFQLMKSGCRACPIQCRRPGDPPASTSRSRTVCASSASGCNCR